MNPELRLALRYENLFNETEKALFIDSETGLWQLIMTYTTSIEEVRSRVELEAYELGTGYAEIKIQKDLINELSNQPDVVFLGLPIRMSYTDIGLSSVCGTTISNPISGFGVTGAGTLIGIIDSGIDYTDQDFISESGTSRIAYLWNQAGTGDRPLGYPIGTEYTRERINEALLLGEPERSEWVPEKDLTGHGTTLARIAAGNGRAVGGNTRGVAPNSSLIIVKLGEAGGSESPTNLEVMLGIKYVLEKARALNQPVSILIGVGENLTAHNGTSVLEMYIDLMQYTWACNITTGSGNQGNRGTHTAGIVREGEDEILQLIIEGSLPHYACSIWYNFSEDFSVQVRSPSNEQTEELDLSMPLRAYLFQNTAVLISISQPLMNQGKRHIYILFQAQGNTSIMGGIWTIQIRGRNILTGEYNAWSAIIQDTSNRTRFLNPSVERTLVAPSTALSITSVGAINGNTMQLAPFSGRGFICERRVKPDIVAPGVDIPARVAQGQILTFSGTSAAAAFVTGAYALLMEYGMLQLGDLNLYGEVLKYTVMSSARRPESQAPYPNISWGYGSLCIERALNALREGAGSV